MITAEQIEKAFETVGQPKLGWFDNDGNQVPRESVNWREHQYKETGEWEEINWMEEGDGWTEINGLKLTIDGTEYIINVIEETGGMDKGSHASVTFQVGNQYFRKEGYYASHYGYDWDGDFFEVVPKQVQVTQYEKVK